MSKLAKAITAEQTGHVKLKNTIPFTKISSSVNDNRSSVNYAPSHEYRIGALFEVKAYIDEPLTLNDNNYKDYVAEALNSTRRAIIEEIFGEFRPLLTQLNIALYDIDLIRAKKLLAELEYQMFMEFE